MTLDLRLTFTRVGSIKGNQMGKERCMRSREPRVRHTKFAMSSRETEMRKSEVPRVQAPFLYVLFTAWLIL